MLLSKKTKLMMGFVVLFSANVFLFQNCSKTQFSKAEATEFGSLSTPQSSTAKSCSFNGQSLNDHETVLAYQGSTVPYGQACKSESRTCSDGTLSGSYEAKSCQVLPRETTNICSKVSQVVGDMRTEVQAASSSSDYSTLEFGTFADNYWVGNPETFDRKLELYIDNSDLVSEFILVQAAFDDWIAVSVNGRSVYYGPYADKMTQLVVDLNSKEVEYAPGKFSSAELGTSWDKSVSINIKPYLVSGKNTITVRTVVAGAGECFLKFKYKTSCQQK